MVRAYTPMPDMLNEWVVEVDGVRRARFVGSDAAYFAAREANKWRRAISSPQRGTNPSTSSLGVGE